MPPDMSGHYWIKLSNAELLKIAGTNVKYLYEIRVYSTYEKNGG